MPAASLDAPATVTAYKNLAFVERDFRHLKTDDLDLRPIFHWLEDRVRAHVLICRPGLPGLSRGLQESRDVAVLAACACCSPWIFLPLTK